MHKGTAFIFTNKNNKIDIEYSFEFNGNMGLTNYGKELYKMLQELNNPQEFDNMIREFDEKYFQYCYKEMTFPLLKKDSFHHYDLDNEQYRLFYEANGKYIYTSDSNYIKNMTNEDINIVCYNGVYKLKPNQILVSDYGECINGNLYSFDERIPKDIKLDKLEKVDYIPTRKQEKRLKNILKTLNSFDFKATLINEPNNVSDIKIESFNNEGVNICLPLNFDIFEDVYNPEKVATYLILAYKDYPANNKIFKEKLRNLSNNFLTKYYEISKEKQNEAEIGE